MKLPQPLLNSLEGVKGFDRTAFEQVHQSGEQVTSVRINSAKFQILNFKSQNDVDDLRFTIDENVPWCSTGFYLKERPSFTFDPLFHAGCYYVQEASSMFLEEALKQTVDLEQPLKVLDLCAAPGGKSTLIQSIINKESLLVSNEIIKTRSNILTDNIIKWGAQNVFITNNDPAAFKKLTGYFDVIVVDAPCSGSGLFRRDAEAINEWSENNVQLCCQRQQRILTDILPSLKEGGILIYSTCSYSIDEDEDIADLLVDEFEMENLQLQIKKEWGIVEVQSQKTKSFGYRFYPDKAKGEGFFIACFRKKEAAASAKLKAKPLEKVSSKEKAIVQPFLNDEFAFQKFFSKIIALPPIFVDAFATLPGVLNVQYAGVMTGEIMKDKLVPHHALALSTIINDAVPNVDVDRETAIKYLQRKDLNIETNVKGWQTLSFENHRIGWINALQNRINNYYPKEMRILKQ